MNERAGLKEQLSCDKNKELTNLAIVLCKIKSKFEIEQEL